MIPWNRGFCLLATVSPIFLAGLTLLARAAEPGEKKHPVVEIPTRPISAANAGSVSFTKQIKPILVNHCVECHSAEDRKSNFEVSSVATLLEKGKKAGPGVVPRKPDESAIVEYIRGLREPQMPKGNPPLSEDELHLIRLWIAAGAMDDSAKFASTKDSAELDARAVAALAKDSDSQKIVSALLFGRNNEERLIIGRTVRLGLLPPPPVPPVIDAGSTNPIDQFIVAKWKQAGSSEARRSSPVCDDPSFIRRVYLDLIGIVPPADAAKNFTADASPDKRVRVVDELLGRRKDYAANWTPFWEDALASATTESQGGIATHGNYRDWIFRSFAQNKPFDVMVAELIDPTMPGHKKAGTANANGVISTVGYVRNDSHLDTVQSAANTAQVFLGTGMKCAGCHSHFLNKEWPQARFLAFAGMFAPKDIELIRCEKKSGEFIPAKFPFELPGVPEMVPEDKDERLHRLALLIVDPTNPRFARTIVNRLWKRYIGLGLFEPADDFRLDQPPSHPELLDWLADDFMRHGYDLKHTIRLILTSRTYQLCYDPKLEDHFDVAKPADPRYFRSPQLRRVTAEQLIDSIRFATTGRLDPPGRAYLDKSSTALTRSLGRPASRNEISTGRPDDVAVVQALELLNGPELSQLLDAASILDNLASDENPSHVVEQLYWATLSRAPTGKEMKVALKFLKDTLPARREMHPEEVVWLDDELPDGTTSGEHSWKWISQGEGPVFSGSRSHRLGETTGKQEHFVENLKQPLHVEERDVLFTYVYFETNNPPKEIMLQWKQDDWNHRAYWGENKIDYGTNDTSSRRHIGDLPRAGEWVRLEVPAKELGLKTGEPVTGWSFDQAGGTVFWDKSGVVHHPRSPAAEPLGDALWALVVSPEFQYIH